MESFWRRYSLEIAAALQLLSTLLFSIWVNFVTATPSLWATYNLLLITAVAIWLWQLSLVRGTLSSAAKQYERGALRLGVIALSRYASVDPQMVRGFVHEVGRQKPAAGMKRTKCLIKLVSFSQIAAQDTGPIDLELPEHQAWFFNVRAYQSQQIAVGDIDWNNVPHTGGRAPAVSHSIKSVLSFPIMEDGTNNVVATLTFDSQFSAEKMRWLPPGQHTLAPEVEEIVAEIKHTIRCLMLNLEPDSA